MCRFSCLIIALWLWTAPAAAVDRGKTSYTAEAVCAFRAIGATDPDIATRNPDHMAAQFVSPAIQLRFPGMGLAYADAKIAMDRMNNGVFYYINARTHHMDAMLAASLEAGARQVVILGAGFDSRAYRFHNEFPEVRFFEIDLPATAEDKQQRVVSILGRRPAWVSFVSIDFNTQTLEEVLIKAGFSPDQKTFYVWEGVTYFISQAGVDNTLRFIAEHSAPGSRVVFDYMLERVVQGRDYSAYGARRTVYAVAHRGEPYVFGIAPQRLKNFVHLRGLALLSDLGPEELSQRYLIHSDGTASGKISEFLRIVHAEVPDRANSRQLRRQAQLHTKRIAMDNASDATPPKVDVPHDVQLFLDGHSRCILNRRFDGIEKHFSDKYRANGRSRQEVAAYIERLYRDRAVQHHKIILTRFEPTGDSAKIDGYIQREGFRTPLMGFDIIKDTDGRWRWHGNQR